MKTTINLFYKTFLLMLFAVCVTAAKAQDKDASIKSLIESKHFVFKAQTVMPTSMPMRQLSGESYDLRIFGDSVISYLPYFGRTYVAPMPGERGGYEFTSTKFDYKAKSKRKGGWEISIKPKDVNDFREFNLIISEKGYATLQAISNNRQPISYSGYIASAKAKS